LSAVSALVRVHAATGDAADAETVPADAVLRAHLLPEWDGLRARFFAMPLGDAGPAFPPGAGGAIVFGERDGRRVQTRRDLADEKCRLADALAACPTLGDADTDGSSWLLADLESSLRFLLELRDMGDGIVALWPRGGMKRVRRARGFSGLSLTVRRKGDWLGVDGKFEADEGLVLDSWWSLPPARRAASCRSETASSWP
jgi:hypothetical protein